MLTLCFCKVFEAVIMTRLTLEFNQSGEAEDGLSHHLSSSQVIILGDPPSAGCLLGADWWTPDWLPSDGVCICLLSPALLNKQREPYDHLRHALSLFCHIPLRSQSFHRPGDLLIHRPNSG